MAYDFYDVESLQNVFTVVTYSPEYIPKNQSGTIPLINIYYVDDSDLIGQFSQEVTGNDWYRLPEQFEEEQQKTLGYKIHNPNKHFWTEHAMKLRYSNTGRPTFPEVDTIAPICSRIYEKNPILAEIRPTINIYDLHTPFGAYMFAREFLYRPDPQNANIHRLMEVDKKHRYVPEEFVISDTDEEFAKHPEKYPYLLGYNSYNYDTTIIAYALYKMFDLRDGQDDEILPIDLQIGDDGVPGFAKDFTAKDIREFNDVLFSDEFKSSMSSALRESPLCGARTYGQNSRYPRPTVPSTIRDRMLRTGRHLDVARLNEKQSKVGLKRLLGMMGYQILESDKLSESTSLLNNFDEFCDLIAYNVSDVVYLSQLFEDPVYKSQFEQKSNMLKAYPELVYEYKDGKPSFDETADGTRTAQVDKSRVRPRRLYADSSSQQLASRSLCPDGFLPDLPKVSLMYPHEKNEHVNNPEVPENVFRRDILKEAEEFFKTKVLSKIKDDEERSKAAESFNHICEIYHAICESNFDGGRAFTGDLGTGKERLRHELIDLRKEKRATDKCAEISKQDITDRIETMAEREPKTKDDSALLRVANALTDKDREKLAKTLSLPDPENAGERTVDEEIETALHEIFLTKDIRDVAKGLPYNIFYYDGNGKRTSCFATFSTGGVHGAEFALAAYERDRRLVDEYNNNLRFLQSVFGDDDEGARKLRASVRTAATPISQDADGNAIEFPDGRTDHLVKEFLKNVTLNGATWAPEKECEIFDQKPNGSNKLRPAYAWTSAAYVNHEDFSSYYPSLLRMMRVFYNDQLGYDRYGEIYQDKERLGRLMKATEDSARRYKLGLDRAGVKLILNTASGAGDAGFDNPVRMNNNIIAMRIIGQLFTWRIGQAQALEGAKVISTNTDGLYTKLEKTKNDLLLAREADQIGVAIEPEPMYLISKDSNNRIEFDIVACKPEESPIIGFDENGAEIRATVDPRRNLTYPDGTPVPEGTPIRFKVLSVAGATLACREGPNPARSLAHPAATDWALSEYLMRVFARYGYRQSALEKPFDPDLAKQILSELHQLSKSPDKEERVHGLMMFQNVIASNPNSYTFVYTNNLNPVQEELLARLQYWNDDENSLPTSGPTYFDNHGNVRAAQHYTRVFIMKPKTENTTHIYDAVARIVPKPTVNSRRNRGFDENRIAQDLSQAAAKIISEQGLNTQEVKHMGAEYRDIISKKHSGIEPEWSMRIENSDLRRMSNDEIDEIYENLDLDIYHELLRSVFENNWRNHI